MNLFKLYDRIRNLAISKKVLTDPAAVPKYSLSALL